MARASGWLLCSVKYYIPLSHFFFLFFSLFILRSPGFINLSRQNYKNIDLPASDAAPAWKWKKMMLIKPFFMCQFMYQSVNPWHYKSQIVHSLSGTLACDGYYFYFPLLPFMSIPWRRWHTTSSSWSQDYCLQFPTILKRLLTASIKRIQLPTTYVGLRC